jgi:hypothetical protein
VGALPSLLINSLRLKTYFPFRLASTWPKVLSLELTGLVVSIDDFQEWMKVSKPAVMRFRPTTRNDPNFGDLVELLRVRSCVSLPPVFDQPPAEAFAARGCKLGALRKLPSHEKPSHETGRAVSAWCCIPGLGHTGISQALLVVGLICCTATHNCLVSKTTLCTFILCDRKRFVFFGVASRCSAQSGSGNVD